MTTPDNAACDRDYGDGGAHTVSMRDGVAICVGCGQPIREHRKHIGQNNNNPVTTATPGNTPAPPDGVRDLDKQLSDIADLLTEDLRIAREEAKARLSNIIASLRRADLEKLLDQRTIVLSSEEEVVPVRTIQAELEKLGRVG